MKYRMLFNEGGDGGSGGGGGGAPPAPAPFLGAAPEGGAPPAGGNPPPTQVHFFRDEHAKEGKFNEGWSQKFADMGFGRLASKAALVKDETGLFKMLDDTIGHASGRKITRPVEGASDQQLADYRGLVGAPDQSAGYEFMKSGLPEGATRDDMLAEKVEGLLFKHHAPKELGSELSALYLEQLGAMREKGEKVLTDKIAALEASTSKALRDQHGEGFDDFNNATKDFLAARKVNVADPMVRYALMHPEIVAIVNEARLASREAPLPGVKKEVFSGSGSPRQQAMEIMKADKNWERDPEKVKRVNDLYAQDAATQKRKAGAR